MFKKVLINIVKLNAGLQVLFHLWTQVCDIILKRREKQLHKGFSSSASRRVGYSNHFFKMYFKKQMCLPFLRFAHKTLIPHVSKDCLSLGKNVTSFPLTEVCLMIKTVSYCWYCIYLLTGKPRQPSSCISCYFCANPENSTELEQSELMELFTLSGSISFMNPSLHDWTNSGDCPVGSLAPS